MNNSEMASFSIDARSAIADSMMVAQAHLLSKHHSITALRKESEEEKWERNIRRATRGKCEKGSIYAVTFLANKYSYLFKNLAFVDTDVKTYDDGWDYHRIFIAQDNDENWYSASPANFSTEPEENRLTRLDTSPSLKNLMKTVRDKEGGHWPTSDFIKSALENSDFNMPHLKPATRDKSKLTALKISARDEGGAYYTASTESLMPWESGQIRSEKRIFS